MRRFVFLLYSLVSYGAFLGSFIYAIGFAGNLEVSKSIDGNREVSLAYALFINASLLTLFALQYAIMRKPAFKSWLNKFVAPPIQRSTYVLIASLCMILLIWQWQPIGGVVWIVTNKTIETVVLFIYLFGWAIVFMSSFLLNHFDLFGLRQTWYHFRNKRYTNSPFPTPFFNRFVRGPLYLGLIVSCWAVSTMTIAHLVLATFATAYMLIVIQLEGKAVYSNYREGYFG